MFALTESTPLYLCRQAVDMRKGIDGLYRLVRTELQQHPLSGSAFVFFSKNRQSVKILRWDGDGFLLYHKRDGFLLYHKRLERGTFETPRFDAASGAYRLPWKTFSLIMEGISLRSVRYRKRLNIAI